VLPCERRHGAECHQGSGQPSQDGGETADEAQVVGAVHVDLE
jgi:hypothetical protein